MKFWIYYFQNFNVQLQVEVQLQVQLQLSGVGTSLQATKKLNGYYWFNIWMAIIYLIFEWLLFIVINVKL